MTSPSHPHSASPSPAPGVPTTARPLLIVFAALLGLLALTVLAARLHLGAFAMPVALLIAGAKTALIAIWFMELRVATGLVRLAAGTGLAFLTIAFALTWLDYLTRT